MKLKFAASAAALATAFAGPAMAAETVNIDVVVQNIAFLETTDASGQMTIDNQDDTVMGNPSSSGSAWPGDAAANWAEIKLSTNHTVQGIDINFPRTNGIKNFGSADYFGKAIGVGSGDTLGVWPHAGVLGSNGEIGGDVAGKGQGQCVWLHDGSNTSLQLMGDCRENGATGLGNGMHDIAIGVSTNWDRTLVGEPTFASPDTYSIAMTATIIP